MKKLPFLFFPLITISFLFCLLNSHYILAEEPAVDEEPEIIFPENSLFCTDFKIEYETTNEQPTQATEESESTSFESEIGEIVLENEEVKQPDFSIMNNRLQLTLLKLMPIQLNEIVDLDSKPLETRAKHFVIPREGESIPETKFILPDWWTNLLGQTKIFCGLFSASERCIPPKKLTIKIERPEGYEEEISKDIDLSKEKYYECNNSGGLAKSTKPELKKIEDKFNFSPEVKKNIFAKFIEKIKQFFIKTEKIASLENKTRGVLIGGHTLINQSEFFSDFIPHEINSSINDNPLAGEAKYTISEGFTITDEEAASKENYQEQNKIRTRYCLQLCSLYPPDAKFNVSNIDPICISCNPKDYQN